MMLVSLRNKRLGLVFICVLNIMPAWVFAESAGQNKLTIEKSLLTSGEWRQREGGFRRLIGSGPSTVPEANVGRRVWNLIEQHPEQATEIRRILAELLEIENAFARKNVVAKQEGPEAAERYSAYYGDLIEAVACLDDPVAINALAGAIHSGGIAMRALIKFGREAIPAVDRMWADSDPSIRHGALLVYAGILKKGTVNKLSNEYSDIRRKGFDGATDKDALVRMGALRVLNELGDSSSVELIKAIAERDPARLPGKGEGGKDLYPVRNLASRLLAEREKK